MTRSALVFVAVQALAFGARADGKVATACDLSDAGIRSFYEKSTGRHLGGGCITMPSSTFKGLLVVKSFAYDAGCLVETMVYRCSIGAPDIGKRALVDAGYLTADAKRKGELAFMWLAETSETNVLDAAPEAFSKSTHKFEAPSAVLQKDGSLVVRFWERARPGMRPGTFYGLYTWTIAADGTPGILTDVDRFEAP